MKPHSETRKVSSGIAIVGPGRLGQALGKLLARAGFPLRLVAARRPAAARRGVQFIGCGRPIALSARDELMKARVILLTVADRALSQVARDLGARTRVTGTRPDRSQGPLSWRGKVVLHTCGSLPSTVLQPLKCRGASIGSLHPFQTIPNPASGVRSLRECYWGVEGDGPALEVAYRWVKALGGVAFRVRPAQKTKYHLAAFLACPAVVTLMDRSLRLLEQSGVSASVARPMLGRFVAETARNFVELGARRALTGPAARGDWPTIRRHLAVLGRFSPDTIPAYTALVRAMVRLASRRSGRK